jgi:hypothetical protein
MSLEGLNEAQVKQLASGMDALLNSTDAEVRKGAQRLLKKVDPKLNFPEIEMEHAITQAVDPLRKENETLRNELKEKEFTQTIQKEHERIVQRGYKVEDVQKFMKDRGIVNYDTAMSVMDMEQRLAAPTPDAVSGVYDMPESQKEIFKNPAQWARKTAHNVINELTARKRA